MSRRLLVAVFFGFTLVALTTSASTAGPTTTLKATSSTQAPTTTSQPTTSTPTPTTSQPAPGPSGSTPTPSSQQPSLSPAPTNASNTTSLLLSVESQKPTATQASTVTASPSPRPQPTPTTTPAPKTTPETAGDEGGLSEGQETVVIVVVILGVSLLLTGSVAYMSRRLNAKKKKKIARYSQEVSAGMGGPGFDIYSPDGVRDMEEMSYASSRRSKSTVTFRE